jgi:hypothetical protein
MIVTLDDDCRPYGNANFLRLHAAYLTVPHNELAWERTCSDYTRGIPYQNIYRKREVILNHGLWKGIPDEDSVSSLSNMRNPKEPFELLQKVIHGDKYFPMCGMNLAFKPIILPAFYFLLMGEQYGIDRFGDIWAGIILKKICDHLGYAISSGVPYIKHERLSNLFTNLKKEARGIALNEGFWEMIDNMILTSESFGDCYWEIAVHLYNMDDPYFKKLCMAMKIWERLVRARRQ